MESGDSRGSGQDDALELSSLPMELLAHIFSFIETERLYPSCFLINSACLSAVLTDLVWKERCKRDLEVDEQIDSLLWRQTYAEHATQSEAQREKLKLRPVGVTYAVSKNIVFGKNLVIQKDVVSWNGRSDYVSVRASLGFTRGRHTIIFEILNTGSQDMGVGFVGDNWDCRMHAYTSALRENYVYWKQGGLYEVSGLHQPFPIKRFAPWGVGSVIGATVDFDEQKVSFSLNGEAQDELPLNMAFKKVWPVVTMYDGGPHSVRIRRGRSPSCVGVERRLGLSSSSGGVSASPRGGSRKQLRKKKAMLRLRGEQLRDAEQKGEGGNSKGKDKEEKEEEGTNGGGGKRTGKTRSYLQRLGSLMGGKK